MSTPVVHPGNNKDSGAAGLGPSGAQPLWHWSQPRTFARPDWPLHSPEGNGPRRAAAYSSVPRHLECLSGLPDTLRE